MASYKNFKYSLSRVKNVRYLKQLKSYFHTSCFLQDAIEIKMPSLSPTMNEGTIVKWYKNEGDELNPGDLLCDIQTDKAVIGFEFEEEGILAKIIKGDNSKEVRVGTLIGMVAESGTDWKNVTIPAITAPHNTHTATNDVVNQGKSISHDISSRLLGPVAKNLLHQYQLNASLLQHTGPHGILIKSDVLRYIEQKKLTLKDQALPSTSSQRPTPIVKPSAPKIKAQTQVVPLKIEATKPLKKRTKQQSFEAPESDYVDIPVSPSHKQLLNQFSSAKNEIAHSYLSITSPVDATLKLCHHFKEDGMDVKWMDVVVKAAATALQKFPQLNSLCVGGVLRENCGVNVALNWGELSSSLVIKDAADISLIDISQKIKNFKSTALTDSLSPSESSVMIHHIEGADTKGYLSIIKPPSICSISVSELQTVLCDQLKTINLLEISLCIDSRFADDTLGSQFLQYLRKILETPSLIITNHSPSIDLSKLFAK